jgi:hypothetical protein
MLIMLLRYWSVACLVAGVSVGCGNEGTAGGVLGISKSALVGTWVNRNEYETRTIEFKVDDTFVWSWESSDGDRGGDSGTWSVHGFTLTTSWTESGETSDVEEKVVFDDGGVIEPEEEPAESEAVPYKETEIESFNIGLVNRTLYFDTLNRVSGSGGSLDGRWRAVEEEAEQGFEGDVTYDYKETETVEISISGQQFEMTFRDVWTEQEGGISESGDETESASGRVAIDGDRVSFISTDDLLVGPVPPRPVSFDGGPEPVKEETDEMNEILYGYRIALDVILIDVETAEEAADEAFTKVE